MKEALRGISTADEAGFVCRELQRLGFLKAFAIAGSRLCKGLYPSTMHIAPEKRGFMLFILRKGRGVVCKSG
jgi:hypothetical protein